MTQEMTDDVKKVLERVEKLLRLAASNPNESEAASATAKAQDLLAAYNLDMAAVEENSGGTGKRAQEELLGGRFEWQRSLWEAVAELNFCIYWNQYVFVESSLGTSKEQRRFEENGRPVWRTVRGMWQYQHRIVGRLVNIAGTKAMATYLEGVCDRIAKEKCRDTNERPNGRWANSFRDGLTYRVTDKIYERRRELMAEETQKRRDEARARAEKIVEGASSATALTLASFAKTEEDANIDFRYGEGTSARWAANRAAQAAADRAADEEYTRWAAANPEKAAKQEAERKAKRDRALERENRSYFKKKDAGAWSAGFKEGENVPLDLQTDQQKPRGLLR